MSKPATARYIGFGEQGGKSLVKNTEQLNYFNFDNMRYRQVYNRGPLDTRNRCTTPIRSSSSSTATRDRCCTACTSTTQRNSSTWAMKTRSDT